MGLLSAAMKAELAKASPIVFPVISITFPSGVQKWSIAGVSSGSQGHFDARVLSFGTIRRAVSDRESALESLEASIVSDDGDLMFSKLVGSREDILNAQATIYLALPAPAVFADWYTAYVGRLYSWRQTARLQGSLTFRPPDLALEATQPALAVGLELPDAGPDAIGARVPILYGRHDSAGTDNRGAVPALCVDTVGWRWLVCSGAAKEITRVYGGLGIAIISTPKGLMTGQQAWRQQVGGELLCYVW